MDIQQIRSMVVATGEEIRDDAGTVIGFAAQPARFRISQPYLARGGFLVVTRDEESGAYIGTEFDALPHPKTRKPYPAGHSEQAFRTTDLEDAVRLVAAYRPGQESD